MSDGTFETWERPIYEAARAFPYPPTPDIAQSVRRQLVSTRVQKEPRWALRRLAWSVAIVLALLAGLLAVPSVRAQIVEFLQIGIVRIFLVEPSPTPTQLPPTISPESAPGAVPVPSPTHTPRPSPTPLASLLNLSGETTLEKAGEQVDFAIQLPAYPSDLGVPDRVFLQDLEGQVLVLVWLEPEHPDRVRLSLHLYSGEGNLTGEKVTPRIIQETTVNGQPAVWAEGPYMLRLSNGNYDILRLIDGQVLIWEAGGTTYRLETDVSLEEARRIAESLQPLASSTPPAP